MRIGRISISGVSLALLVFQLLVVSSIAAKYLYQRWTCPRVWIRAVAYDPELPMRGRYLAVQLMVDGCQSTLPSAKLATFPRDFNGAIKPGPFVVRPQPVEFRANLKVENSRLIAMRVEGQEDQTAGEEVSAMPGGPCDQMHLTSGTDFFVAEHTQSPLPLQPGQELWIEVTIPPNGPPRPIQLALKDNGAWKPLNLN
jgi:hypothetical protein